MSRKAYHLMTGQLNGSRLVNIDMTGLSCNHGLIRAEHAVKGGGIGLGAASKIIYLGIGDTANFAYLRCGTLAVFVKTVGQGLTVVGLYQMAQHFGVGTIVVVAFK